MNKLRFQKIIVSLLYTIGFVNSEELQRTGFVEEFKNTFYFDAEVGLGILFGIRYERVLTKTTNVEIGLSPISVFGYRGMVIPFGPNIFLPFGHKHKIAVMLRLLFYTGGDPGIIERESHSFTSGFNRQQHSLYSYGLYYQYKSNYLITYRFGVGAINSDPIITASVGYNF